MSTTSCPRCSRQVTLPVGVSNSSKVRCPLCKAQYTLADALVNMPPLLEVVDHPIHDEPVDWFGAPPAVDADDGSEASTLAGLDLDAPSARARAVEPMGEEADEIEFAAEEAPEDDLAAQGSDTEIEELSFSTFDSASPADPDVDEPVASADDEDNVSFELDDPPAAAAPDDDELALDLGGPELGDADAEAETIQFADRPALDGDEIDFGSDPTGQTATGDSATVDFGAQPSAAEADPADDVKFDFDEPAMSDAETVEFGSEPGLSFESDAEQPADGSEFGDLQFTPEGEADDIEVEAHQLGATSPVSVVEPQPEEGKKKGKKKKEKAARLDADGKPKRSLVGSLARVGVPALVSLLIVAYAALWISPSFDYLGMGSYLPQAMLPAGMNKNKARQIAQTANRPSLPPDTFGGAADPTAPSGEPVTEAAPGEEKPAEPAPVLGQDLSAAPTDAAAPTETTATPPEPTAPPTDAAPTESTPPGAAPPAEVPAAEPPSDPFAADPEAEKMPAKEGPAGAEADPFAESKPTEPAAATPAADDPFASPAPAAKPTPEAPPAAEEKPAADAAAPAADDPFAPAPADKPAGETKPAAPTPAAESLPEPEAAAALGPRNAPPVSGADVMGALQATQAAGQQMMAAESAGDQAQLSKARANFYVSLFNMANAITIGQMGPGGAQLSPQLAAMEPVFRQQFSADPKRLESLKVFGARWFAFPKRTNNGVVLAGTVESIDHVGPLFHAKIKPGAGASNSVTIVSAKDPQLAAGDEVLTLGSIVEKPADELSGYEGSEPAVVWSGMTMKLAPASQP